MKDRIISIIKCMIMFLAVMVLFISAKNMKNIGYRVFVRENGIKAKSVTVYGDDPLRFNSKWQQIGLINFGNNNCRVTPEGHNSVTCS